MAILTGTIFGLAQRCKYARSRDAASVGCLGGELPPRRRAFRRRQHQGSGKHAGPLLTLSPLARRRLLLLFLHQRTAGVPGVEEVVTWIPRALQVTMVVASGSSRNFERATAERGMHCGVFRIETMVGISVNGIWNTTEAIPLLVRSAQVIDILPDIDDYPSFLPIDVAAHGISEIVRAGDRGQTASLYPVVNANMTTHGRDMHDFFRAAGLVFDVVDWRARVERLAEGPSDLVVNPTYKLLDFYRNRYGPRSSIDPSISRSSTPPRLGLPSLLRLQSARSW
ncbi:hypothetical protein PENSPDRAFT_693753 [Peniophora sp. CONT]|nr:hypothetical protein PENSPDRAFT_693753 [Peniophora sp. CONT]